MKWMKLSQDSNIPYPEADEYNSHPDTLFLNIILIILPHLRLGIQNGLLPSGFLTKILN
jgi:hypothetical protein